jgi:DNA-directed RNA polymerase subunit D
MEIIKETDSYIEFILNSPDIDFAFANYFRHIITNYIPIYAIDTVDFFTHDSQVFPMQFIAHRLGQLPIKYSKNVPEWFYLNVKNNSQEILTIYSDDIEPKNFIVFDKIPIIKLGINEEIKYACKTRKSIGAEHVKWSPVTIATFEHLDASRPGGHNNTFYFKVESVGQISIKKLIKMTFKQMKANLKDLKTQLKDIDSVQN